MRVQKKIKSKKWILNLNNDKIPMEKLREVN